MLDETKSRTPPCDYKVSDVLARWESSLTANSESLRSRLWDKMRGTMFSVAASLTLMCMVLMAVGVAGRSQGSQGIVSSLIDLVYAISLFGCSMALLFFSKERKSASMMLRRLKQVAMQLENDLHDADHREKLELFLSARRARKWFVGMRVYATLAGVSVTLPHFATLRPVPKVWPPVGPGGVFEPTLALAFAGVSVICCVGYSEFLSLQLVATISSTGMYRALAARLQRMTGKEEDLLVVARLHGQLNSAVTLLEKLFSPYLPYYLLPPLGGTALATCGFLYGAFSSNFMSLVPQIFIIFMPLCLCGDALQLASGEGLLGSGYDGTWLEWSPSARRTLLFMMVRCTRPQVVSVRAFGYADRKACLSVLKTWFSFLQTLTNLSDLQGTTESEYD